MSWNNDYPRTRTRIVRVCGLQISQNSSSVQRRVFQAVTKKKHVGIKNLDVLLGSGDMAYAGAADASAVLSFFISRDLRRAALLAWITPFDAARSNWLIA